MAKPQAPSTFAMRPDADQPTSAGSRGTLNANLGVPLGYLALGVSLEL